MRAQREEHDCWNLPRSNFAGENKNLFQTKLEPDNTDAPATRIGHFAFGGNGYSPAVRRQYTGKVRAGCSILQPLVCP